MRNLAAALGAGTMTLYHYVRTKDELFALVNDAVMGEVVLPSDQSMPEGWRDALAGRGQSFAGTRSCAIPGCSTCPAWSSSGPTPCATSIRRCRPWRRSRFRSRSSSRSPARSTSTCSATASTPAPCCRRTTAEPDRSVVDYVLGLLASGDYPALQAKAELLGVDEMWALVQDVFADLGRFDRGLELMLDGVEVRVSRASSGPRPSPSATSAPGPAA